MTGASRKQVFVMYTPIVPHFYILKLVYIQGIQFFLIFAPKHMSRLMGKPTISIGENKDADQLCGNREADQCLCFRYSDSTIPLLLKSEISSFQNASVTVQPDLCRTCSETTLLVFPRGGSYIDCGYYSFECPLRGGSNMYQQSILAKILKISKYFK